MNRIILLLALAGMFFNVGAQTCDTTLFPDGKQYYDTYHDVVSVLPAWKHYNTHDPTVNKQGEWYYMYSTDASWANLHKTAALKRRSKDLINWEFLGNAFNGIPQSAIDFFRTQNPSYTDQGIWAPFLYKHKDKFLLYYSAPGGLNNVNFAYIGYATSDSAGGPWEDQGMITTSYRDTINAIDPSVIYDSVEQRLWMAYGSWERGLYMLELDTATGGIKTPGDKGFKIARRTTYSAGLEGGELTYRNGWYYLFVSYDPLGDLYNVRVGRSRNATGPYYDFNGRNMATASDNMPMVQAPYKFNHHPGWQGTGHCGVYNDNGKYYMFNQGRPSIEPAMMVLHVREIFWIDDWPVLSPERYAGVPSCPVAADSLVGKWEHMPLLYHTTTASPYHSTSEVLELSADGTFNSKAGNTWAYDSDTLTLNWSTGPVHKLIVFRGWDWENSCMTLLYTGINKSGVCAWGKKTVQSEVDRYTKITDGATYTIRNLHSHMLMHVPGSTDVPGTIVKQGYDNGSSSQLWKIKSAGNGYHYLFPLHSQTNLVMEVRNGATNNFAPMVVNPLDGSNKQKFKIVYNNNGYFRILSRVTSDASCAEVVSYNITESGTINQNVYSGLLNQLFRFERIDSIAIDTVSADTFTYVRPVDELSVIQVYPNPTADRTVFIDLGSLNDQGNISISVLDLSGSVVYQAAAERSPLYQLDLNLSKGVYILSVNTDARQYLHKLVIQ